MFLDLNLVEAAGIEPATIFHNQLIFMGLTYFLLILGRKWGFFDTPYLHLRSQSVISSLNILI